MSNLKEQLMKLANEKPELRSHLVPLLKTAAAPEYEFLNHFLNQAVKIQGITGASTSDMDSRLSASVKVDVKMTSAVPEEKGNITTYKKIPVRSYRELLKDLQGLAKKSHNGFFGHLDSVYKKKPQKSQRTEFGYGLVDIYYPDEIEFELVIRPVSKTASATSLPNAVTNFLRASRRGAAEVRESDAKKILRRMKKVKKLKDDDLFKADYYMGEFEDKDRALEDMVLEQDHERGRWYIHFGYSMGVSSLLEALDDLNIGYDEF